MIPRPPFLSPWAFPILQPRPQQAAGAQRPLPPCILSDAKSEASCWNFPFGLQGAGPPSKDLNHRWNHTHTPIKKQKKGWNTLNPTF